jgi:hypothetical protein
LESQIARITARLSNMDNTTYFESLAKITTTISGVDQYFNESDILANPPFTYNSSGNKYESEALTTAPMTLTLHILGTTAHEYVNDGVWQCSVRPIKIIGPNETLSFNTRAESIGFHDDTWVSSKGKDVHYTLSKNQEVDSGITGVFEHRFVVNMSGELAAVLEMYEQITHSTLILQTMDNNLNPIPSTSESSMQESGNVLRDSINVGVKVISNANSPNGSPGADPSLINMYQTSATVLSSQDTNVTPPDLNYQKGSGATYEKESTDKGPGFGSLLLSAVLGTLFLFL